MKRTRPWELSDEVWERVRPLILTFSHKIQEESQSRES